MDAPPAHDARERALGPSPASVPGDLRLGASVPVRPEPVRLLIAVGAAVAADAAAADDERTDPARGDGLGPAAGFCLVAGQAGAGGRDGGDPGARARQLAHARPRRLQLPVARLQVLRAPAVPGRTGDLHEASAAAPRAAAPVSSLDHNNGSACRARRCAGAVRVG